MSLFARRDVSVAKDQISEVLATVAADDNRSYRWWVVYGVTGAILAIAVWYAISGSGDQFEYRTGAVRTIDLVVQVTATGTLEPVKQVEVGTEVSGIVLSVLVDENDRVKAGQVLARLNPERLQAERTQKQAALVSAEAALAEVQATVAEAAEQSKKLVHLHELSKGLTPSKQELQAARATHDRARAQEVAARAQINEARAALDLAEINLTRTVIRSPISGIVLQREIEPGQTVAASLATPLLFLLAENLTQLVLNVAVNEADIGVVKAGQNARFTVDAFPGRIFPARITRVRFSPETDEETTSDTVVTYETTLHVNNTESLLRPGMTATADIIVEEHKEARVIPNAALRFEPPTATSEPQTSFLSQLLPGPPRSQNNQPGPETKEDARDPEKKQRRVWALKNDRVIEHQVTVGATDGTDTILLDVTKEILEAQFILEMSLRKQ